MNIFETLNLSLTAIFTNRLRAFLTILGIVIGVTSVILLVALVSGLKSSITEQISGLGSNLIFVVPGSQGGSGRGPGGATVNRLKLQDATELEKKLGSNANVSPVVTKAATVKYAGKSNKNVTITGAQDNFTKANQAIKAVEGRFINASESNSGKRVTVIGPTLKNDLFGSRSALNQTIQIGDLKYQVIGVLNSRGSTFGIDQDNSAIIPLSTAQRQFGIDNLNAIYISAKTPEMVKPMQLEISQILKKRLSEDDFTVQSSDQALETISQVTGALTVGLGGVAAISLIVGGIGIMNIMLVSVTERTREIGLRKALGAKPKDIRNQFLIEAITLSGLGGVIGILLGIALAMIANNFITTTVTWWSIALSFGFSMLVGVIFGVAPALRAAKLDPIQALRYE